MAEPGHQTRAGSERPGLLIPGLVPLLLGILDFVGKRLQLRQGVRPSQLSMLAIRADPVQVVWTAGSPAPKGLVYTRLVYLGHADGVMLLRPAEVGHLRHRSLPGRRLAGKRQRRRHPSRGRPARRHTPRISVPHPS